MIPSIPEIIFVQNYRSASLSETQNRRVLKYLVPVVLISVLLNIPKFLETSVQYDPEEEKVGTINNQIARKKVTKKVGIFSILVRNGSVFPRNGSEDPEP